MVLVVRPQSRPPTAPRIERWPLRGGAFALDFANTVAWRPAARAVDGLRSYDDLLAWCRHAGILDALEEVRLRDQATGETSNATAVLTHARELREAIYRIFTDLDHGREPAHQDLATVQRDLAEGVCQAALVREGDTFVLRGTAGTDSLALPLWRLAESAAQLLVSGEWRRVHECPGDDCGWLFLDKTRNGNRRWCDSADCGNRARVRAHASRQRKRRDEDQPTG